METKIYFASFDEKNWFKSYYVVWKLGLGLLTKNPALTGLNRTMQYGNFISIFFIPQHFFQFKSYYVVWKLHMTVIRNIAQAKFKSYYVVWKLFLSEAFAMKRGSV